MKLRKTLTALVFSLALVGAFTLVSHAVNGLQEIKAYLNADITFKLDGETKTLTDATGSPTFPITYNNTTYLPVRSIADMLGVEVGWDQATQTVLLGRNGGVDLIDTYIPYDKSVYGGSKAGQVQTAAESTENISGVDYSHWIYFDTNFNWGTYSLAYNLQGKHNTLTFSYYAYNNDAKLRVLGDDGMLLGEYPITAGAMAKTVTVPLFGTKELRFEVDTYAAFGGVRIMDVRLDAEE